MKKLPTIRMVQTMPARWELVSQNGHVLQKDINVGTIADALEYVRNYASSFPDWSYEVIPLKK